jgi:hypothetical protein
VSVGVEGISGAACDDRCLNVCPSPVELGKYCFEM